MPEEKERIRVVVVDDEPFYPNTVKLVISLADDIEWIGHAENAERALDMVLRWHPQVVFVDLGLKDDIDGIELMRRIHERSPSTAVIILTVSDEAANKKAAFAEGMAGYLVKGKLADPSDFHGIIRDAAAGRMVAARDDLAPVATDYKNKRETLTPARELGLTEREREVLGLLAEGLKNKQIAQRIFLSENTVKHHLDSLYRRLGVKNRQAAVSVAFQRGLLPDNPGQ
ncbi:MAG TPA: response regulator transcription factor [Solirubrobacteraceae bacterium]|jgi:DNA-binding NarL/FixJ family response regulator